MNINIEKQKTKEQILFCILGISLSVLPYLYNTLYKIFVIFIAIYMLLHSKKKKKSEVFSLLIICWILFVLWSYFSSLWTDYMINIDRVIVMAFIGIEIFSFGLYLNSNLRVLCFFKGIIFGALALAIEIVLFYGIETITASRFSNEILNSNQAGGIFAISGILSVFLLIVEKQKRYLIFAFGFIVMIFLSGSRTAILSFMGALVIFFMVRNSGTVSGTIKGFIIAGFLVVVIFVLIIIIPTFYNIIGERLLETFALVFGKTKIVTGYNSNYLRTQEYIWAFQLIKEHPILGVGLDNFRHYNPYDMYAHCNYLEIWSDLGLVGFIIYYAPFSDMVLKLKCKKMSRNWKAVVAAYITYFLILNVSSVIYYHIFDMTIMSCFYYLVVDEKIEC